MMPEWVIPLLTAIGGASVALIGREIIEWRKRPKLEIDFEEYGGEKLHITDLFLKHLDLSRSEWAKFLRLNVHNAGCKPAMNCEAKMVIFKEGNKESFTPILHWARRDHIIYETPERIYAPVHVNKADEEPLDLFQLSYESGRSIGPGAWIESMSARPYQFERNITYRIEVTVYASNTVSKPFAFRLRWDGTLEGFNKAFTKD